MNTKPVVLVIGGFGYLVICCASAWYLIFIEGRQEHQAWGFGDLVICCARAWYLIFIEGRQEHQA